MKILYISDLDGTLLGGDQRTSDYTNRVINGLVEKGMIFSYATARSYVTSHKVTRGLDAKIPLILYNGSFVLDNVTGERLISNYFEEDAQRIIDDLLEGGISFLVYSMMGEEEKFSYLEDRVSPGLRKFLDSRKGDRRNDPVKTAEDLLRGRAFYITCIDEESRLRPFYEKYRERYHCVFQVDLYTKEHWLEIMPKNATKANAARQLQALLGRDRIVAFGDGKNDIDLFQAADECYAVANGVEELKAIATAVIDSNDNDGVAKWLAAHVGRRKI